MTTIGRILGRRRRWLGGFALAAALVAVGAGPVAADETVRHDAAGDAAHIGLIGDSTLAGVRWFGDYGALERFDFVFNAESCRRTIDRSCVSREGDRSRNVLATMQDLEGELGEVLVVMAGYNDPAESIEEAIEAVVDEARDQGVGHVVWLTLRTSSDVDYSDPQQQSGVDTFRAYNEALIAASAASDGYLQVADWATHSDGMDAWFAPDGVHLTARGVDALTSFIADAVDRVLAGEELTPAAPPWVLLLPGVEGEVVEEVQAALIAAGIDLPGGVDGVYGDATMIAVAEFQRRHGRLDVTGAVDGATAAALGVWTDPDAPPPSTTPVAGAGDAIGTVTRPGAAAESDTTAFRVTVDAGGGTRVAWLLAGASAVLAGFVVAVVAHRRRLVARRRARRWARVHPSTSPHRSVADLRRAGLLPPRPVLYDHEREEMAAVSE